MDNTVYRWVKASVEPSQHYVNECCRLIGEGFWFTAYYDTSKNVYVPRNFSGRDQYIKPEEIEWLDENPSLPEDGEGWISVEDRLPEAGHYIAAYFNPSDSTKKLYVLTAWRGRDGWYWDNSEKEKAEDSTLTITHWQPLPTAPGKPAVGKEDEQEKLGEVLSADIHKAARLYLQLPTHRQIEIWKNLGYTKSWSYGMNIGGNNEAFFKWVKLSALKEFVQLMLNSEPDVQVSDTTEAK